MVFVMNEKENNDKNTADEKISRPNVCAGER